MNRIQFPLETDRLELTTYKMSYCKELFQLKQFPETHRYNYSQVATENEVSEYVKELSESDYTNPKDRLELAIIDKRDNKYIGFIGFKGGDFQPDSTTEIFYTLSPAYFKKGYATEAVTAMIRFGFTILDLHRIWAGATCENTASWKVMEKVGMRRESLWLKDRPKPGEWLPGKGYEKTDQWEDGYGYAILKNEFSL